VAVTGSGRAAKSQMQAMVMRVLSRDTPLVADEADALAAAICHLHAQRLTALTARRRPWAARGRAGGGGPAMIARLAGRLVHKSPEALIVDVHGVGFRVHGVAQHILRLARQGEAVTMEVHTHLRENALETVRLPRCDGEGALRRPARRLGRRTAGSHEYLSGMPTTELLAALAAGDVARLVALPGVGKKTAERLVVELQDRVRKLDARTPDGARRPSALEGEAASALVNLG